MAAALAVRWDSRCDMTCVSQEALRHSVSVAEPLCDTRGLSHRYAATRWPCRSDTPCMSHHDFATLGVVPLAAV